MAIRPEDCSFITGYIGNDGSGASGWGIAAFLTGSGPQAYPVGYALGYDGPAEGPANIALQRQGVIERVGTMLYHLGAAYGSNQNRRTTLSQFEASDAAALFYRGSTPPLWDSVYVAPVALRSDGERLYAWTNNTALGRWLCSIFAIGPGGVPSGGDRLSWTVPGLGQWHHAVSRGALYVLNPLTWRVEVWDCTDVDDVSLVRSVQLPDHLDPTQTRIACDDHALAVGIRHFVAGAGPDSWRSSLIVYDTADPMRPTERWRIAEEFPSPTYALANYLPIGISGADLIFLNNVGRVLLMDVNTQAVTAASSDFLARLGPLDWDVRDGLLFAKVKGAQRTPPEPYRVFSGLRLSAIPRWPGWFGFEQSGYGWWPSEWRWVPEDLGHRITVWGPGIVGGWGAIGGGLDMWTDASGGIWVAWEDGGTIRAARMTAATAGSDSWDTPVTVATQTGVRAVGISGHGDRIHVSAQLSDRVVEWRTVDFGASWEGPFMVAS